uniref:RRM Nup35-type domain-containing protein n=1 Tax=Aegilops tauschii subsp. strangulata TaxID=200361 RepID=A0A453FEX7_AEGTS
FVCRFTARETNLVLREFGKCGVILRHCSGPGDGNWLHILYQSTNTMLEGPLKRMESSCLVALQLGLKLLIQCSGKWMRR